jgi:hypothetical protein
MAKINARGAREVARFTVASGNTRQLFVLTSDGRVLHRYTGELSTGYSIYGRIRDEQKRNSAFLRDLLTRRGYEIL